MSKTKRVEYERPFQDSWTNGYLFIEQKGKPLWLMCQQTLALSKAYNVKRHYESFHKRKVCYNKWNHERRFSKEAQKLFVCRTERFYRNLSNKLNMQ